MKKSIAILTMLFMISSFTFATTPDDPNSSIAVLKTGATIKLLYKSDEQADVKVSIFNADHQIVFSEKIKNTGSFARPYNFSLLPEGDYSIQLTNGYDTKIEHVSYSGTAVKNKRVTLPAHVMHVPGTEKFLLAIPNRGKDRLNITIYNNKNVVLYSGNEEVSGDFAKIYNLKGSTGMITFVVTDSDGTVNSLTKKSW
jgi:uncharacterized protein YfaP (DUF2135 family)